MAAPPHLLQEVTSSWQMNHGPGASLAVNSNHLGKVFPLNRKRFQ